MITYSRKAFKGRFKGIKYPELGAVVLCIKAFHPAEAGELSSISPADLVGRRR